MTAVLFAAAMVIANSLFIPDPVERILPLSGDDALVTATSEPASEPEDVALNADQELGTPHVLDDAPRPRAVPTQRAGADDDATASDHDATADDADDTGDHTPEPASRDAGKRDGQRGDATRRPGARRKAPDDRAEPADDPQPPADAEPADDPEPPADPPPARARQAPPTPQPEAPAQTSPPPAEPPWWPDWSRDDRRQSRWDGFGRRSDWSWWDYFPRHHHHRRFP